MKLINNKGKAEFWNPQAFFSFFGGPIHYTKFWFSTPTVLEFAGSGIICEWIHKLKRKKADVM